MSAPNDITKGTPVEASFFKHFDRCFALDVSLMCLDTKHRMNSLTVDDINEAQKITTELFDDMKEGAKKAQALNVLFKLKQ